VASGQGTVLELDLSDLKSVSKFAKAFIGTNLPLNFLILNAGIMMVPELELSAQGYEKQFAVNHLGGFQLSRLLESKILATGNESDPARLIYLSSEAAEFWGGPDADGGMAQQVPPCAPGGRPYHPFHLYNLAKALNVLTAKEQQRRWGPGKNAIAVAVHPGIIRTALLSNAGPIEGAFYGWPFSYAQKSVAQGASTTLYAALAPNVVTEAREGEYFYYNNAAQSPWRPEFFSDGIAKEVWERSLKLVR